MSDTEGTSETKITAKVVSEDADVQNVNVETIIKSSYNMDAAALDINVKVSASMMSVSASANLVATTKGEIYVRINDLDGLLTKLGMPSGYLGDFDVSKVSDKWLKISLDDLEDVIPETAPYTDDYAKALECVEDVSTTLTEKRDAQKELLDAITKSKMLTAKRVGGDQDGIKFELNANTNHYYDLIAAVMETDLFQSLGDCFKGVDSDIDLSDPDINISQSEQDELNDGLKESLKDIDTRVNFWVSPWGHQPTRLLTNSKVKGSSNIDFTIDTTRKSGKTEIKIPSDSTSLISVIQELMAGFSVGSIFNYDDYSDIDDYDFDDYDYDDYVDVSSDIYEYL
jgi:hypothetical protein